MSYCTTASPLNQTNCLEYLILNEFCDCMTILTGEFFYLGPDLRSIILHEGSFSPFFQTGYNQKNDTEMP